jgi:thioredoxin 2
MIHACGSCGAKNRILASRLDDLAQCGRCHKSLLPLDAPHPVASAEEFDELVRDSPLPVLVDFWAAWCGPCKMIAPEVEALAKMKTGLLVVAKVDTEAHQDLAARYRISGIPALVLFRHGKEARRASGAMPATAIAQAFGL